MIEFKLPSLGSDMDDGVLVQWHVHAGDAVRKGQVVAVVDTTKAAIDVECWDEGTVHALVAEPGQRLPVGVTLAVLRAPGESADDAERAWAALRASAAAAGAQGAAAASTAVPATATAAAVGPATTGAAAPPLSNGGAASRRVSPAARRLAQEQGIDLSGVRRR
ncbi:MAG: biotin/lipoyl-containing protein [Rubrivivax sp.]